MYMRGHIMQELHSAEMAYLSPLGMLAWIDKYRFSTQNDFHFSNIYNIVFWYI